MECHVKTRERLIFLAKLQAKDKQPRVGLERRQLQRKEVYFDTPMSQDLAQALTLIFR